MVSSAFLAMLVFGIMGVIAYGLSLAVPVIFDRMPAVLILTRRLGQRESEMAKRLQDIQTFKNERRSIDDDLARVEKDHRVVMARKSMFPTDKPLPVVELGQPTQGNKMFEVFVHNTGVRRARRLQQLPPLNPFWEEPRYVVVWAGDLAAARNELNTLYPADKEWHVEFRGEVTL